MTIVGELTDDPPSSSALLALISKLESVKHQKQQLTDNELESLKQELQMFNNHVDHLLGSNSMRQEQVEAEKRLMTDEKGNLRLQFRNNLPHEIETGIDIKAKDLTPIEVAIVDDSTWQVVNSGPEASALVEMVALRGHDVGPHVNLTTEEFNKRIISTWGKSNKPLLLGGSQFNLNEGIGTVGNIKFRHCKDWMKQNEFMLGARVVGEFTRFQIKEAKTEPFKIKDRRNGYYSKRDTLTMEDEIYRLKNISHKGTIRPRLQKENIYTVKDFLHCLFEDPAKLKLMIGLPQKQFEETIKHAQKGMINDRLCCYYDLDRKMIVVFDFVSQVLGVVSGGRYHRFQGISDENRANAQELAIHAFQSWKDVHFIDNEDSLLQKFPLAFAFEDSMISSEEEHNIQKNDISRTINECNESLFGDSKDVLINESTMISSEEEHNIQKSDVSRTINECSETLFGDSKDVLINDSTGAKLKLFETVLLSDDIASPLENHSEDIVNAEMEEYQVLIQRSCSNDAPIRCSKPWVFMISVVLWKRVILKSSTSTKRDYPLPETSTVGKKLRIC